jgi:hypothetical protein
VEKPEGLEGDHKFVPEVRIFGLPFFLVIRLDRWSFQVNKRG